jgi:hypothetical protein
MLLKYNNIHNKLKNKFFFLNKIIINEIYNNNKF